MTLPDFRDRALHGRRVAHVQLQVFHLGALRTQLAQRLLLDFSGGPATGQDQRRRRSLSRDLLREQPSESTGTAGDEIFAAAPPRRFTGASGHLLPADDRTATVLVTNLRL